jgi:FkbM family methyltransferase
MGYEWDAALRPIADGLLPPEPAVCEVGSNIGASLLQVLAARPQARALALEPSRRFLPYLVENLSVAGYGEGGTVRIVDAFVGRTEGEVTLHTNATTASAAAPGANYDGHEAKQDERLPMTTLDRLLQRTGFPPLDLLKVDTDGYDFEVLHGAEETLARDKPILYVECSPNRLPNAAAELRWLQSLGFRRFLCFAAAGGLIEATEDPERVIGHAQAQATGTFEGYVDLLAAVEGTAAAARVLALLPKLDRAKGAL